MKEHEISPSLRMVSDDHGRLFLYCRGCQEHKAIGDGLEFQYRGRARQGWLAISTALRQIRTVIKHMRCGEESS